MFYSSLESGGLPMEPCTLELVTTVNARVTTSCSAMRLCHKCFGGALAPPQARTLAWARTRFDAAVFVVPVALQCESRAMTAWPPGSCAAGAPSERSRVVQLMVVANRKRATLCTCSLRIAHLVLPGHKLCPTCITYCPSHQCRFRHVQSGRDGRTATCTVAVQSTSERGQAFG